MKKVDQAAALKQLQATRDFIRLANHITFGNIEAEFEAAKEKIRLEMERRRVESVEQQKKDEERSNYDT